MQNDETIVRTAPHPTKESRGLPIISIVSKHEMGARGSTRLL